MASGMRVFTERIGDGVGKPILDADHGEELMHVQDAVSIVLGNRTSEGPGTLHITSKQVIWLSDVDRSRGYAVDFVSISLHAISKDPESYPSPCIYSQIDTGVDESEDEDEEEEEEESEAAFLSSGISKIREMRLVPSDANQLEKLFEVFCECAEMNPEPMEDEVEEQHNWIFSADQLNGQGLELDDSEWIYSDTLVNPIGHSFGDHDLAQNVLQLRINDQRFEDAEDMEHAENGA